MSIDSRSSASMRSWFSALFSPSGSERWPLMLATARPALRAVSKISSQPGSVRAKRSQTSVAG